jgi:hypothetical protein
VCRYFKPKNVSAKQLKAQAKKWGDKEKDLLLQAIEKHGIGSWALVKSEFLPQWVCGSVFGLASSLVVSKSHVLPGLD